MSSFNYHAGGSVNYTWGAAGNMTGEGATSFQYDAASRLKTVNNGTTETNGFDGDSQRVKKVEGGVTVFYIRSSINKQAMMEIGGNGAMYRTYVYAGGKLVAQQSPDGQFYWQHTNHLGSGYKLTSTSGTVTYRAEFDPYGQVVQETGSTTLNSHKFTGYEKDQSTGLDYASARMFSSGRGRFITPDPMGLKAADTLRPATLNRYTYVENEPVNKVDPSGLECYGWFLIDGFTGHILDYLGFAYCDDDERSKDGGKGGGSSGGGTASRNEAPKDQECLPSPEELAKVDDYLERSGLSNLLDTKNFSRNGNGYLVTFSDAKAVLSILNDKDYWAGGSFGGALHADELKSYFNAPGGVIHDYRSFNGGNTILGNLSMQVTLIYGDEDKKRLLGAYVDVDKHNFRQDAVGFIGHTLELLFGRKPCIKVGGKSTGRTVSQ
jgi:RHS repeat-associated protein